MKYLRNILILLFVLSFSHIAFAEQSEWKITVVDGDIDAEITYYTTLHQEDAGWVKEAIEKAWPMYNAETGVNPATTVSLYVGDVFILGRKKEKTTQPDGMMIFQNGICKIYISPGDEKHVKSTTVHELFHCWQDSMKLKSYTRNTWMWEATAVWAEDWVYKNYASEHGYDQSFFNVLDTNLLDTGTNHEYGSYIYFYKMYQQAGFSPTPVITLLKQLKTKKQSDIIKDQQGIHENIKEFALWNWNKEPFKEYTDTPSFPNIRPSGTSIKSVPVTSREEYKAKFETDGGGAQYIGVGFAEGVDKVVFKVSEYNTLNNEYIGMQALIKINDEWHYEDWSDQTEKTFCRGKEAQKVQVVVLIASNSHIADIKEFDSEGNEMMTFGSAESGEMTIDATGECPVTWSGTITYTNDGGGSPLAIHQKLEIWEELEEVMNEKGVMEFEIVKQEFTYTGGHTTKMPCLMEGCPGDITSQSVSNGNTVRTRPEDEEYPSKRFLINEDDEMVLIVEPQMYGDCDYVTTVGTYSSTCSCMGSSQSESWSDMSTNDCHSINGIETIHKIPTAFSEDAKHIKGTEAGTSEALYYRATISWDYSYE